MSNNNHHLEQVYERSQKLTEALYRVTDLFSDSEPLKWLLRRDGLDIFESILKIKTSMPNERVRGLSQITDKIRQTVKVFELAASGSFISEANFQVLKREYSSLADYLSERSAEILPEPSAAGYIGHESIGQLPNGQQTSQQPTIQADEIKAGGTISNEVNILASGINNINGNNGINNSKGINGDNVKNGRERREEILSLIKEGDWISVGELAEAFRGRISGKTLQRDLVSMASQGLLLREGEKRWRRYKSAQEVIQKVIHN